ncbi:hypothetical protein [Actinophytocola sp.]|uniref:hypothetical protein n=1 Tax=Actinophytocola sp. TaxID=1872138 RepID=UPI00389A886B
MSGANLPKNFQIESIPKIDADTWRKILNRSAGGDTPPMEHLLLCDSRRSLILGEYRRAVLDAGTAAELSLTRLLDSELEATTEPIRKMIRKSVCQLGPLVETLRGLGMSLPDNIQVELIRPRNLASHAGISPTDHEASKAVAMASVLVDIPLPHDKLLD